MTIASVSDVTVGYGTPQLPMLTTSLMEHFGASGLIVEPAQPEAPPKHGEFPHIQVRRVTTMVHPHTEQGRQEYVWRAAGILNALRPEVVVICCTYCLPVLFRLKYRPKTVIYYSVESISFYGAFDCEMNRYTDGLVDIVIFPEENRGVVEVRQFGFRASEKLILYNTTQLKSRVQPHRPTAERNGRILYSGTIHPEQTLARYFLHEKMMTVPVDLFGPLKMPSDGERDAFLAGLSGAGRYRGYISSRELSEIRKSYLYSIVIWNPVNENQLYAAPNKFFESIADGVPPISAPHPQCKLMIDRYGCGILMDDWSFEGFHRGIEKALKIAGTREWETMVDNCGRAVEAELNWDDQFAKVKKYLKN